MNQNRDSGGETSPPDAKPDERSSEFCRKNGDLHLNSNWIKISCPQFVDNCVDWQQIDETF